MAKVAAGLLSSGWHVAWPMEDGGAGYDLLAHRRNGKAHEYRRIQVKTTTGPKLNRSGSRGPCYKFSSSRGSVYKATYSDRQCDLVVFVAMDRDLLWVVPPQKVGLTFNPHPKTSLPWDALSDI